MWLAWYLPSLVLALVIFLWFMIKKDRESEARHRHIQTAFYARWGKLMDGEDE